MVVPVADATGAPAPAKKLRQRLKRAVPELAWDGPVFTLEEAKGYVGTTANGRVIVASERALLDEVVADRGEPWVSAKLAEAWTEWSLSVHASSLEGAVPGAPSDVSLGLRAGETYVEGMLSLDGGSNEFLVGMLAADAVPNFVEMQHRAKRAECAANLAAISAALPDRARPAAASPRPMDALDKTAVPWVAGEGWSQLAWTPSGALRGSYWIEANEEAVTVYCAIDADGNKEPAVYRRVGAGETEQVTGPKVY
jgi:hypothetical protein